MNLKLIEKKEERSGVKTFIFNLKKPLHWKAGQYLIYSLSHKNQDLRGKMRFFTISSSPFEKRPAITTRIEKAPSSFKKTLNGLKNGALIEVKGPDGDFTVRDDKSKYIFIAGGIGITPFRSILKQLEFENKDLGIVLLYSSKNKGVVFKKELDNLRLKNLKIEYFIGKKISKAAIEKIKDFKKRIFYVSGPDPLVDELEKMLNSLGIPKDNQNYDYFSGYKDI